MVPGTVAYIGMPHCRRWADTVFIGKEGRMVVEPLSLGQTRMAVLVPSKMVESFLS